MNHNLSLFASCTMLVRMLVLRGAAGCTPGWLNDLALTSGHQCLPVLKVLAGTE